jgi:hypothetical protein
VTLEERDRLGRRRLSGHDDLRIGRRLELRQRCRPERRQRQGGDGINDAIEFERAGGLHQWLQTGVDTSILAPAFDQG